MIIQMRFVQAEANQYLLLIENGKLVKSGVGIRVFKKFSQSVVIYNSNLNKVLCFLSEHQSRDLYAP